MVGCAEFQITHHELHSISFELVVHSPRLPHGSRSLRWRCHQRTAAVCDRHPFILTPLYFPPLTVAPAGPQGQANRRPAQSLARAWRCGDAKATAESGCNFLLQRCHRLLLTPPARCSLARFCVVDCRSGHVQNICSTITQHH